MTKKMKKKKKLKIIPLVIFLLIIFLVYIIVQFLIQSKIKNIYIYDNQFLSDQEIIDLANLEAYPSFIKTTSKSIINKIKENKLVKDVKVKKRLFNQVHIYVEEYTILFQKKDKSIVLSNSKEIKSDIVSDIPMLLNYVPDTIYNKFIKEMTNLKDNIRNEISEIEYAPNNYDQSRFLMYMNDGNYVYLTLTKFDALNYYNEVYPTLGGKKGILYLDSGNHFKIME